MFWWLSQQHKMQQHQHRTHQHQRQLCRKRKPQQNQKAGSVLASTIIIHSPDIYKARKDADILPANFAMNEKIRQLREQWECSMTTCHSEVCFIPAEGPHFALSHDLTEKWAAAIVCLFLIYMSAFTHIG